MSDPKPPMPAQPATKKLLAITPDEIAAAKAPRVVAVNTETLDAILNAVHDVKSGLTDVRGDLSDFKEEVRSKLRTNSEFRRTSSQVDSTHDAAIASIITEQAAAKKRDEATQAAIAQNTAITVEFKRTLLGGLRHPAFIGFLMAALGFATAWFTRHT